MALVTITIAAADNGGTAAVVPVLVTINSAAHRGWPGTPTP